MNVNDKLQLIRALEEREIAARRTSGRVAWTSVIVAALVLLVMIGLAQRQVSSLNRRAAVLDKEVKDKETRLADLNKQLANANTQLSNAEAETLDAAKELEAAIASGEGGNRVRAALANVEAASVAAKAPTAPIKQGPARAEGADRKDVIARLFHQSPAVRVQAYGELLPRYANDSTLVPEILDAANKQPDNANGTYNALVVLSHMNARALSPHRADVIALAERSKKIGPRVADRARTLIKRVPAG